MLPPACEVGRVLRAVESECTGGALLRRLLAQASPERFGVAGQFPRWYGNGIALEGVGCRSQQAHLLIGPPQGGIYDRRGDLDSEESTVPTRFVDEEEHAADG
jgi:hypothetical protein